MSIEQLAKELKISHNTIRRRIKSDETLHKYVKFHKTFSQVRIYVKDYKGLKSALKVLISKQ